MQDLGTFGWRYQITCFLQTLPSRPHHAGQLRRKGVTSGTCRMYFGRSTGWWSWYLRAICETCCRHPLLPATTTVFSWSPEQKGELFSPEPAGWTAKGLLDGGRGLYVRPYAVFHSIPRGPFSLNQVSSCVLWSELDWTGYVGTSRTRLPCMPWRKFIDVD